MKSLVGPHLVWAVVTELRRNGFVQVYVNQDRSSVYLRYPGLQFRLRVSDHHWSKGARARHLQVVHNAILNKPIPETGVKAKCAEIVGKFKDNSVRRIFRSLHAPGRLVYEIGRKHA